MIKKEQIIKTDEEWKNILSSEQYRILRKKGTEKSFTGAYWNNREEGVYLCNGCGTELFSSEAKFDSGTGWPSFKEPVDENCIDTEDDYSIIDRFRIEIHCSRCGGHLGHVFDDGPLPTKKRYCVNSAALKFVSKEENQKTG